MRAERAVRPGKRKAQYRRPGTSRSGPKLVALATWLRRPENRLMQMVIERAALHAVHFPMVATEADSETEGSTSGEPHVHHSCPSRLVRQACPVVLRFRCNQTRRTSQAYFAERCWQTQQHQGSPLHGHVAGGMWTTCAKDWASLLGAAWRSSIMIGSKDVPSIWASMAGGLTGRSSSMMVCSTGQ